MSAFALASVVGVPVGIYLGNRFDWHAPFLVLAALGLPVLFASIRAAAAAARSPPARPARPSAGQARRDVQPRRTTFAPSRWSRR